MNENRKRKEGKRFLVTRNEFTNAEVVGLVEMKREKDNRFWGSIHCTMNCAVALHLCCGIISWRHLCFFLFQYKHFVLFHDTQHSFIHSPKTLTSSNQTLFLLYFFLPCFVGLNAIYPFSLSSSLSSILLLVDSSAVLMPALVNYSGKLLAFLSSNLFGLCFLLLNFDSWLLPSWSIHRLHFLAVI